MKGSGSTAGPDQSPDPNCGCSHTRRSSPRARGPHRPALRQLQVLARDNAVARQTVGCFDGLHRCSMRPRNPAQRIPGLNHISRLRFARGRRGLAPCAIGGCRRRGRNRRAGFSPDRRHGPEAWRDGRVSFWLLVRHSRAVCIGRPHFGRAAAGRFGRRWLPPAALDQHSRNQDHIRSQDSPYHDLELLAAPLLPLGLQRSRSTKWIQFLHNLSAYTLEHRECHSMEECGNLLIHSDLERIIVCGTVQGLAITCLSVQNLHCRPAASAYTEMSRFGTGCS